MGDAETPQERHLMDRLISLKADVLKVAHHGSNSSSHREFLYNVSPSYAVISVGKDNPHYLPSYETVSALEFFECKVFYTDDNGLIRFFTDGEKIKVFSEK